MENKMALPFLCEEDASIFTVTTAIPVPWLASSQKSRVCVCVHVNVKRRKRGETCGRIVLNAT